MSNFEQAKRDIEAKIKKKEHAAGIMKYAAVEYKAKIQALKSKIAELESTYNGDSNHDIKISRRIMLLQSKQEEMLKQLTHNEQLRGKVLLDIQQLQNELEKIQQEMQMQPTGA